MKPNIHISSTKDSLARDFANWMLEDVLSTEGMYHIALSGGSTPKLLFDILAVDYKDKFPWNRIHLWWGDERMVGPDDPESNYGMTNLRLISGIDIPSTHIHRVRGEDKPEEEVIRYGREIQGFLESENGQPVFQLMMLGMGGDGHTASIFPNHLEYLDVEDPTLLARHPDSGQLRVSLSGKTINQSRKIAFLVAGDSKKEKVKAILKKEHAESYPAFYIRGNGHNVFWFLDEEAASEL
ncbi:MAG: 6-phosphogluconolactonase [Bacteroidota bacterium]